MRLRNITGSKEFIAANPFVIHDPENYKGRFVQDIFHNDHPLHIEIGMGKGRFMMDLAASNPDINYIGIEKYSSVLLRAIQKMEQLPSPLPNLFFIRMDACDINDVFAENEIDKIYLNFSDPWPKERHADRRLTSGRFLKRYEHILKDDAIVEFKTDNKDLFDFTLTEAPAANWNVLSHTFDLHNDPVMNEGNIMTEYEEKFSSMGNPIYKCILGRILSLIILFLISSCFFTNKVYAVSTPPTEEQTAEANQRMLMRVETNEIDGWPDGPLIGAHGAILMDADTGVILYEKNIHDHLYPASTTKLMTALLAIENSTMDEIVTFSNDAIYNIESSSSRIGINVGEQLTMEQCLYGLLLGSSNESAYAIAEHIGGTYEHFIEMMNDKAAELGCVDTHFVNANGLPAEDHYTSAYDLALIAKECFKNESLLTFSGTVRYTIPPTNLQSEERPLANHHLMLPGLQYAYDGVIAGKTGYTSLARQTLVTLAQKGELRLICVIMKEEAPNQFLDTGKLFDYGFTQFKKMNISDNETNFSLDSATFFHTNLDIIGSSKPILSINNNGSVIIPKECEFSDAHVSISYSDDQSNAVASLSYDIGGHFVGSTTIDYADNRVHTFEFANIIADSDKVIPQKVEPDHKIIFIDTNRLVMILVIILVCAIVTVAVVFGVRKYLKSYHFRLKKENWKYKKWNRRINRRWNRK